MDREFYGQDWPHLVDAIRSQFMSPNWIQDRQREFEEMSFRQKGYSDERPVAFIQRRIRFHSFLYPQDPDGPNAVARVLRTQRPCLGRSSADHDKGGTNQTSLPVYGRTPRRLDELLVGAVPSALGLGVGSEDPDLLEERHPALLESSHWVCALACL